MRTEIAWAELHAPLFLAGTNLGQKLDPKQRSGIKMEYDESRRHLYVSYNGKTCRIPETSVLSMVEAERVASLKERVDAAQHAMDAAPYVTGNTALRMPVDAQVSTPTSHVFAGPGGGTTGQENPKRGPGRPKGT